MNLYTVSPQALRDLREIWDFIARDNEGAADRLEARVFEVFRFLARTPRAGHPRHDLTSKHVLFFPEGLYLIVYRISDPLEIVAILHGARNIRSILRQRKV